MEKSMSKSENPTAASGDSLKERVAAALQEIRPYLQRDGGDVELVDVVDKVVKLRLQGACAGCPMSMMTLKNGIENFLREREPEVQSVEAVGLTI